MTQPCIITVAITGAVPRKKDNPAVPVTPAEQIESTQLCQTFQRRLAARSIKLLGDGLFPGELDIQVVKFLGG